MKKNNNLTPLPPFQRNTLIIAAIIIAGIYLTNLLIENSQNTINLEKTNIAIDNLNLKSTVKRVRRDKNNMLTSQEKGQALTVLNHLKNINQQTIKENIKSWDTKKLIGI